MRNKTIVLTEFPGPCNFKCNYCYLKQTDNRRKPPFKKVTAKDYINLTKKLPNNKFSFHFCGIGEPILYPHALDIWEELLQNFPVITNANMSLKKYETLLNFNTKNLAIWFSFHYDELVKLNKLKETLQRVQKFKQAGITIWVLMVAYPNYINQIDKILEIAKQYNLIIKLMHYRDFNIGRGKEGLVIPKEKIMSKLKNSKYIDWSHWNKSFNRWEVKNKICNSGKEFLVVNSHWNIHSCGGKGNINFGKFPEDLDNIKFIEKGICVSSECPCSWTSFSGCVEGIPNLLNQVLPCNTGKLKDFYGNNIND